MSGMAVFPLAWCPWSEWGVVADHCSRQSSRVTSRRVRCCVQSALVEQRRVPACKSPTEERSESRRPNVACLKGDSSVIEADFHSEFVLIFGGVIIFVGITWAFCRCCRWWIMNCDNDDTVIPSRDLGLPPRPSYHGLPPRPSYHGLDQCEMASVFPRQEQRPSLLSSMSAIEAVTVAQRLMENSHRRASSPVLLRTDSPTIPPPPAEDASAPPAYSDLADSPPPAYEDAPPNYEEATAFCPPPPPPRYEEL